MKHTRKMKRIKLMLKQQVERWSYLATSFGWKVTFYYCQPWELGIVPSVSADDVWAGVASGSWQYLRGHIYFNLNVMAEQNYQDTPAEVEAVVVHELVHLLLMPLQESADNKEYTTETIARVLLGLRNANLSTDKYTKEPRITRMDAEKAEAE